MALTIQEAHRNVLQDIRNAPRANTTIEDRATSIAKSQIDVISLANAAKRTPGLAPANPLAPTQFDDLITTLKSAYPNFAIEMLSELAVDLAVELDKVYTQSDPNAIQLELDAINIRIAEQERAAPANVGDPAEGTVTKIVRENTTLNTPQVRLDISNGTFSDAAKQALQDTASTSMYKAGLDKDRMKKVLIERRLAQVLSFNQELNAAKDLGKSSSTTEARVYSSFYSAAITLGLVFHKEIAKFIPNAGTVIIQGATAAAIVYQTPKALRLAAAGGMASGYATYLNTGDPVTTVVGTFGGVFAGLGLGYISTKDAADKAQIGRAAKYTAGAALGLTGLAYATGYLPEDIQQFILDHMPEMNFNTAAHTVNTGLNVVQYVKGEEKDRKAEVERQRAEDARVSEADIRARARALGVVLP